MKDDDVGGARIYIDPAICGGGIIMWRIMLCGAAPASNPGKIYLYTIYY
jgi:hypothetical protein